jgi:hypothetical protein
MTEHMHIDGYGRVGIGIAHPSSSLQIDTATGIHEINGGSYLLNNIYRDGDDWKYNTTDTAYAIEMHSTAAVGFNIFTAPSGDAGTVATLTNRFHIDNTGNVGIGTDDPDYLLDVMGNGDNPYTMAINDKTDVDIGILFMNEIAGGRGYIKSKAVGGHFHLGSTESTGNTILGLMSDGVSTAGNVGIGTSTPSKTLTVDGEVAISGSVFIKNPNSNTYPYYISASLGDDALRIGTGNTGGTVQMELLHAEGNTVALGVEYSGGSAEAFIQSVRFHKCKW